MITPFDDLFNSASWWAALRLDERRATHSPSDVTTLRAGERRLTSWYEDRKVSGGLKPELDRWHNGLGLSRNDLASLLGESAESLRRRLPERPHWLNEIVHAWTQVARHPVQSHHTEYDHEPPQRPTAPTPESLGFLELIRPLGSYYEQRLRTRVVQAAARHDDHEPLRDDHPLLRPQLYTLAGMVTPVLAQEMHHRSREGKLAGATPQERFKSFVSSLRDPRTALEILHRYPVLARELTEEFATWVDVRAEFAERLLRDMPVLSAALGLTATRLADITDVYFGAGDTHRGGQSVTIITFADRSKVVYKPRSLAVEKHFYEVVGWLNDRGLCHPLRTLDIVDCGEYGWAEFVAESSCTTREETRRFFWRQGAYLALLYALRAEDIHLENLIAAGEHPVFVDLEATFQQPIANTTQFSGALPPVALRAIEESVLGIGLLPRRIFQRDEAGVRTLDMSGLTGAGGDLTPMPVPHWVGAGTDEMRLERGHLPMPGGQNLATVDGSAVDPLRFRVDLVAGFEACYRILADNKKMLAAADGLLQRFRDDEIRPILRPTMIYARLLVESWHPDVLGDALDRACLFEVLGKGHRTLAGRYQIIGSECRQIMGRDIPCFHTTAGSRDLYDGHGRLVTDFFSRSGIAAIEERLARLSEEDLRRQTWCIEAALTGLEIGEGVRDRVVVPRPLAEHSLKPDLALRAARRIGDLLVDSALRDADTGRGVWLSLNMVADQFWTVGPTGFESFTGLNGIALFLAQLTEHCGDDRYRRDAEAIAAMLVEQADRWPSWNARQQEVLGIGAFGELGSSVYTLAHLGALWREDHLHKVATELVPDLVRRVDQDRELDVVSGSAGAVLALLALHAVHPDERIEYALLAAGDHLVRTAESYGTGLAWKTSVESRRPLLGFSHGASGMGLALSRIAFVTGQERFAAAALATVRYEHDQYDVDAGNWPDERDITPEGVFMNAWCHGAAGIGLARSQMLDLNDPSVEADLDAAIATVERDLIDGQTLLGVGNDSLCHGDLGLVETLLSTGRGRQDRRLVELARRVAGNVASSVLTGHHRCGVPRGVHTPGLMMGAAGIGYGLLRTALPDEVPNVLALAAPRQR